MGKIFIRNKLPKIEYQPSTGGATGQEIYLLPVAAPLLSGLFYLRGTTGETDRQHTARLHLQPGNARISYGGFRGMWRLKGVRISSL